MRNRKLLRRLEDDPTVRTLWAFWHWLEEGPVRPRHGATNLGNLQLTAVSGLLLLILLAVAYVTGTFFGPLRGAHFFVGFALIPPLALKLASTGWRFVHYYVGAARYRAAGPPWPLPRLLAPPLVLVTIVAILSGVVLWAEGTERGIWSTVHTDSIVVLLVLTAVHLGIHLRRAVVASRGDRAGRTYQWRWGAAVLALTLGLGLAVGMNGIEPRWHDQPRRHRHQGMAGHSQRLVGRGFPSS
ncbi:MAG: hypothetical protein M3Z66_02075 [Chloroflexota bacterium]|nr:hypothetical protein [Chloroflexota bacterium]